MKFKKRIAFFHSNYDGTIDCRMWQQINVSIRGQCNHGISLRYRLFKNEYCEEPAETADAGVTSGNGLETQVENGRKLIRTVSLSLQTKRI